MGRTGLPTALRGRGNWDILRAVTPRQIGPYPIEREVGRGGMGVVYLGRDTRLDRPIAIKVLPEGFARDPERLARFEREARLLAALTHPNIAGIYGLEEADGQRFLTLEYVEGETLAERVRRGPLALEDTLDLCRQIASALEAAHEAGIIHRDLKPGNVMLTPAGDVKVLDLGLAKSATAGAESSPDLSQSPTMTYAMTGAGVILGTAAYMSPEQARGKPVDRRTDIWSFGCLLYECLTGRQAFEGETVSDLIAMILQGEPDWSKLPPKTPEKLRLLLTRCLERDARRRLRDIGDARIEIEELQGSRVSRASSMHGAGTAAVAAGAAAGGARPRWRSLAGAALLLVAGAAAGALVWNAAGPARREAVPLRFTIHPPTRVDLVNDPNELAISPDGTTLAFVASDSTGQVTLWVRPLGDFEARELPGTKNATLPFWSPDGKQLGFFADSKLKRIRLTGGNAEPICDAATGRGASWNTKDVIVFSPSPTGPLFQVRASGGTPEPVTAVDSTRGETAHRWPCFLPDGEHFTYAALPVKNGQFACYVGSLRSKQRTALLTAIGAPIYAAPGYLIFSRNDALLAQRFDLGRRQVIGDPFSIGQPPATSSYSGAPGASVSTSGVLAWQSAGKQTTRLVWIDRGGRETGVIDVPADRWGLLSLSPDGHSACVAKQVTAGTTDLWMVGLTRGVANRLTAGKGTNYIGAWSPDGKQILYSSNRGGPRDIYRRAADGTGADEVFYQSGVPFKDATDWSPDGKWVVMHEIGDENGWNIFVMPAAGGARTPFLVTPFNEQFAAISPDGRWVVYASDETGSGQAFVQSFPAPGLKQQVSKTGAVYAAWARSGREIFVLRPDFSVVSVPVTPGPELSFGAPQELYRLPLNTQGWWPAPDGQRFLATVPAERTVPGISVAVNWRAGQEQPWRAD
jgi:Tol biopolymer transport system component/predicted Ser/Thr protein kinase